MLECLKAPPRGFRRADDGVLEKSVVPKGAAAGGVWVPVVPPGNATAHATWRKWCFMQSHVGVFGAHRSAEKTAEILERLCYWASLRKDVDGWVSKCLTCLRFRRRPTKQEAVPVKPLSCDCWEEIMVDFEGPSNPPDRLGNRYSLTYLSLIHI